MRILVILFIYLIGFGQTAQAEVIYYNLVRDQSHIGFTYQFGDAEIIGRFAQYDATISIDFERPANSKVSVTLNTQTAKAGFIFATQALRSKKILNAVKYPKIEFVSNAIRADGNAIIIEGLITIRGITKPVTLHAQLLRAAGTKAGERENLQMRITGEINRHDFGASGFPNYVGEMLGININVQIKRQ